MILREVYQLLAQDAGLAALLGAHTGDTKIAPNYAAIGAKPPYLVYRCASGEKWLGAVYEETAVFEAVADNYALCGLILARVEAILRGASEQTYSSSDKRIFCALPCGGADYMDQRGLHVRSEAYRFKFI